MYTRKYISNTTLHCSLACSVKLIHAQCTQLYYINIFTAYRWKLMPYSIHHPLYRWSSIVVCVYACTRVCFMPVQLQRQAAVLDARLLFLLHSCAALMFRGERQFIYIIMSTPSHCISGQDCSNVARFI